MASTITKIVGDNWSGRYSHDQISNGEEVGVFKFKLNFKNITNSKFIEAFSEQSKILNPFKVNYESIKNSFDSKVLSEMASIYLGNNFFISLMEGTELANLTELSVVLDKFTKYSGVGTKADYYTLNKELKPGIIIENKGRKTANEKFGDTLKALDEGGDQVAWTIFKSIYGEASQKYDRGVVVSLTYFSGKPIRMMIEFITSDEKITEKSELSD